ncbi:MAG: hypothetical protein V9G14_02990 [Cypionkella sp.]
MRKWTNIAEAISENAEARKKELLAEMVLVSGDLTWCRWPER